jgi:hypothetical protein
MVKAIPQAHRKKSLRKYLPIWLRLHVIAAGLLVLGYAILEYGTFINTHAQFASARSGEWEFVKNFGPYLLFIILLLAPWWRLGFWIRVFGCAIILPFCIYVITSLLIVDLLYRHQQILYHFFLLSGLLAQLVRLSIPSEPVMR